MWGLAGSEFFYDDEVDICSGCNQLEHKASVKSQNLIYIFFTDVLKKETLNPKNRCTSTHVVDLRMKSQVSVHVCFISIIACFANLKSSGNHLQLG